MSKFIPTAANERMRQIAARRNLRKIHAPVIEACRARLTLSDSVETINECLGLMIEAGISESHAAELLQSEVTAIMSKKLQQGIEIE